MSDVKNFLEEMLESYGEQAVSSVDRVTESIPTGSMSLDISIGIGGIPVSRFTEINGPEQTGKSTLCLSTARNAILAGGRVCYIDAETATDFGYVRDIIPEATEENFALLNPESAEQAFTMAESAIKSGLFKLIILDSLPALSPNKEKENDFGDDTMGVLPRLTSKFLRRNGVDLLKNSGIAFIFVNQVRDKIGSYTPGYSTPGGHALKHWIALEISLTKGLAIEDSNKKKIGTNTKFTIKKNKVSVPFRSYQFPMIFGKGIDSQRDIIDFGAMLGIIKKRGSYYYYEETNLGLGMDRAAESLRNTPEILEAIIAKCYETIQR